MREILLDGGPVMWPLLACSLIVCTVIIERVLFWLNIKIRHDRGLIDEVLVLAETGNWQAIVEKTKNCEDHIVRMLAKGVQYRDYDMTRAMEVEAGRTVKKMTRFMPVLDTMITVAPLLGILGTVLGIIASFKVLGTGGITNPKLVTGGVAQALVTTAAGLAISIATVFPYNYFKSRIDFSIHGMEKYASTLEMLYKQLKKTKE